VCVCPVTYLHGYVGLRENTMTNFCTNECTVFEVVESSPNTNNGLLDYFSAVVKPANAVTLPLHLRRTFSITSHEINTRRNARWNDRYVLGLQRSELMHKIRMGLYVMLPYCLLAGDDRA